jgi:hypothetical protein
MTNGMPTMPNKTDAGNGSYGICRVIDASRSPSPDPKCSALARMPKPKEELEPQVNAGEY